ncbi:4Fe-4S dicluster domain-containing protein [Chloroflexota bacterium]
MQKGIYFDQSRCTGCYTCVVACKDWHDIPAGPASWIRVIGQETGKYPDVFLSYMFISCFHCADPICVKACPVDAITKREYDGIVIVDRKTCLGGEECQFACQKACPYDVPQFGAETNPKMQKCDLCLERWKENKKPICVDACPMRALDAGPLDDLKAKYEHGQEAEGFIYSSRIKPSIILRGRLKRKYSRALKK